MFLTSFIHRNELFEIAERWLQGRFAPGDPLRLTEILICDGFVVGETLRSVLHSLLSHAGQPPPVEQRIHFKGELRDAIVRRASEANGRVKELMDQYARSPEYFYREAPVNGVMVLNGDGNLAGVYRLKRPKRIAEKANRKLSDWLLGIVRHTARGMAARRAMDYGVSLDNLRTPEQEMVREFVEAERIVARGIGRGAVRLERSAVTIHDVGGIKLILDPEEVQAMVHRLSGDPDITILDREKHSGDYRDLSLTLTVNWDRELVCRRFREGRAWGKFARRGIAPERLRAGLEPLLEGAESTLTFELILCTFEDLVESEFGRSIHEERIIAQRQNRAYKGYVPTNLEFLLEYLFAVGFSPLVSMEEPSIRVWGRYLPDTLTSQIRRLYDLPEYDLFY